MPLALLMVGGGVLLLWGGFTGQHPWNPVITAFGGDPLPDPGGSSMGSVATDTGAAMGTALGSLQTTHGALTSRQVYALARSVGFTPTQAANMTAIAYRESRWQPGAVNADGGATGLWQIYPGGPQYLDPLTNARAARAKFLSSQAAGYSGYRPWASSRPPRSPF